MTASKNCGKKNKTKILNEKQILHYHDNKSSQEILLKLSKYCLVSHTHTHTAKLHTPVHDYVPRRQIPLTHCKMPLASRIIFFKQYSGCHRAC